MNNKTTTTPQDDLRQAVADALAAGLSPTEINQLVAEALAITDGRIGTDNVS